MREHEVAGSLAIDVAFQGCGQLRVRDDVPIVDGSFEIDELDNVIRGTFDSAAMASGTFSADLEACSGEWDAAPTGPLFLLRSADLEDLRPVVMPHAPFMGFVDGKHPKRLLED